MATKRRLTNNYVKWLFLATNKKLEDERFSYTYNDGQFFVTTDNHRLHAIPTALLKNDDFNFDYQGDTGYFADIQSSLKKDSKKLIKVNYENKYFAEFEKTFLTNVDFQDYVVYPLSFHTNDSPAKSIKTVQIEHPIKKNPSILFI